MIYSGEGLLQTDDIKARGIADFDLVSLSQRNATNKTADIGHHIDLSDGQFLIAMRCLCFLCNSDAMSMVFGHSYHRNRYDYFCLTIGTDCFPMFFSNLRTDVWQ